MQHTFLRKSNPVLASLDIKSTLEFYTKKLGFGISYEDPNYGIVHRDDIALHFWKCDDPIFPQNTSCYVYVKGIDTLYAEMTDAGVVHPNGPIHDAPYGIREFAILDQDGNMIRFGEEIGSN